MRTATIDHRLGRKGLPTDAAWRRVWDECLRLVPPERLGAAIGQAKGRIDIAQWTYGNRAGVAWSGGKDSVVIHHLAGTCGITNGVYVAPDPELEYSSFRAYLDEQTPAGVRTIYNGLSIDWLRRHPQYLFPDRFRKGDPRTRAGIHAWNAFKWRGQRQFFREEKLDFLILGRRTIDGNVVGRAGINRARDGFVAVNPIFDWPHEVVVAYMRTYDLPLAPIYSKPGGYRTGPRAWAMATLEQVLAWEPEIYERHRDWIDAALNATPLAQNTHNAHNSSGSPDSAHCAHSAHRSSNRGAR